MSSNMEFRDRNLWINFYTRPSLHSRLIGTSFLSFLIFLLLIISILSTPSSAVVVSSTYSIAYF